MYLNGEGVPTNLVRAHAWSENSVTAVWWSEFRSDLERRMTREQLAEVQVLASKLHEDIKARQGED
jgi:hypothetical protein